MQQSEQLQTSGRHHETALAAYNTNTSQYLGGTTIAAIAPRLKRFLSLFPLSSPSLLTKNIPKEHWSASPPRPGRHPHLDNPANRGIYNSHPDVQPTRSRQQRKCRQMGKERAIPENRIGSAPNKDSPTGHRPSYRAHIAAVRNSREFNIAPPTKRYYLIWQLQEPSTLSRLSSRYLPAMPIYTSQVCIRSYAIIQSRVKFRPSIQAC